MVIPSSVDGLRLDVSRRHLMRRAATVGLLMRNCVNLVVALVALADPNSLARPAGKWLLFGVAMWSLYRVVTRSHSHRMMAVDYLLVLVVCLAMPVLIPDPHFYAFNTAPQAIAGTAVISVSVVVSPYTSLPMTLGVAAAYAWGAAAIVGTENLGGVAALFYFALQWATASLIRFMLLRVANAVDQARSDRQAAELNEQVTAALRDFEREQLALLHDTAASTLLMVGQGTSLPPVRLAAQARRDLDLLDEGPWVALPPRVELVSALRDCAGHLSTPALFAGLAEAWLDGDVAKSVIAAARETMNNVDRHARANRLSVTVSDGAVLLEDDGVGFDPDSPRSGHGVTDSIIGRMRRAGGVARIVSAPGSGTATELSWATEPASNLDPPLPPDPDRLIERIRARYGLALTAYALANLAFAVPHAVVTAGNAVIDAALGAVTAASALSAVPGIRHGRWRAAWPAATALMLVTIVQPLLLPDELVGGSAHWTQNAIGWCVLPLVLGLSTRTGAGVLVLYWTVGAVVEMLLHPSAGVLVNIGLGSASILGVQLFALMFNGLMRDAAVDVQAETQARQRIVTRDRVASALRADYQGRYATIVDNVVPLLEKLSRRGMVDEALQRLARAQSRRLRALFDQASTFDHSLMQRLRPLVDTAERRHVDVVIDIAGKLPELTDDDITSLVTPLAQLLEVATTSARLVLTGTVEEISASIVIDAPSAVPVLSDHLRTGADDQVEIVTADEMVWCLIRHRLQTVVAANAFGR